MMKIIWGALLGIFSCCALYAQKQAPQHVKEQVAWRTYSDPKEKVSIKYPATWERHEVQNTIFFFWAPFVRNGQKFRENVAFSKGDAQDLYLVEYLEDARKKMPDEVQGFKELQSKYVKISGLDCVRMIYEKTSRGLVFRDVIYIMLKNGKAYSLNFSALKDEFDAFYPTFEKMANSFKIK